MGALADLVAKLRTEGGEAIPSDFEQALAHLNDQEIVELVQRARFVDVAVPMRLQLLTYVEGKGALCVDDQGAFLMLGEVGTALTVRNTSSPWEPTEEETDPTDYDPT